MPETCTHLPGSETCVRGLPVPETCTHLPGPETCEDSDLLAGPCKNAASSMFCNVYIHTHSSNAE